MFEDERRASRRGAVAPIAAGVVAIGLLTFPALLAALTPPGASVMARALVVGLVPGLLSLGGIAAAVHGLRSHRLERGWWLAGLVAASVGLVGAVVWLGLTTAALMLG